MIPRLFTYVLIHTLTSTFIFSQDLLYENFSEDIMPPDSWSIDYHENNWNTVSSAKAGGTAPEGLFSWKPQFTGYSRLISPEIDLTGITHVGVEFKHTVDHYTRPYSLGVGTRSSGAGWHIAWELVDPDTSIYQQTKTILVDNIDVGQDDFQFCLYFSGDSYNINYWYLDNILLFAPYDIDGALRTSLIPNYIEQGENNIEGIVQNRGLTVINSIEISWKIDDGEIHTDTFDSLELDFADTLKFCFDEPAVINAGIRKLTLCISDVNGEGSDDNTINDTIVQKLYVATQTLQRKPLFEEFTSSTCGPCATFNKEVLHPLLENNEGKYSLIKYQMYWPSPGDPYYTEEGGKRKTYYGVGNIPYLFTDGGDGAEDQKAFDEAYEKPAMMDIDAAYDLDGTVIHVVADILTYVTFSDFTAQIVVVEKVTTGNVGTNGETEFYNVMMKMIPDDKGTKISANMNEIITLDYEIDLANTNIEEWDDLAVAVFVQDDSTKSVFQSEYAVIGVGMIDEVNDNTLSIYPNPFNDITKIELNTEKDKNIEIMILNTNGQRIRSFDRKNAGPDIYRVIWDGTDNKGNIISPGIYFIKIQIDDRSFIRKLIKID